jgi:hypothetical protein
LFDSLAGFDTPQNALLIVRILNVMLMAASLFAGVYIAKGSEEGAMHARWFAKHVLQIVNPWC